MSDTRIVPNPAPGATRPRHKVPKAPPTPGTPAPVAPVAPIYVGAVHVVIIDHPGSGAPDRATLVKYAAAMQRGLDGDFAPAYFRSAQVIVGDQADLGPTGFPLGLFKDPDQPGALGYHSVGFGKVFPLLDAQDGANLSTTIDHELKEAIEDLTIDLARQGSDGNFWADEPCDAVEQDEYVIDGVKLSNFVLPGWYSGRAGSRGYDFLGKLSAPLTVDAGGYAQYFDAAKGWQQVFDRKVKPRKYRLAGYARSITRRYNAAASHVPMKRAERSGDAPPASSPRKKHDDE